VLKIKGDLVIKKPIMELNTGQTISEYLKGQNAIEGVNSRNSRVRQYQSTERPAIADDYLGQ